MMTHLFDLPSEVLLGILGQVSPDDLDPVSKTCRFLNRFVKGNRALCRDIYLRILDPPPTNDLDWEKELHDVVRLQRICASSDPNKPSHLSFVHNVTTRLLNHATPRHNVTASNRWTGNLHWAPTRSSNAELLADIFASASARDAFLHRSFLYDRARGIPIIPARTLTRAGHRSRSRFQPQPRPGAGRHQMSAHLHCLYGMPGGRTGTTTTDEKMYPFACSKVYDLRECTDKTGWGPFRADGSGRVDWEKVEAVLLVLRENIRRKGLDGYSLFGNVWGRPFAGSWRQSYSSGGGTLMPTAAVVGREMEDGGKDPFGVAGTWMRVVCFLDYDEFFHYNFPPNDELPDDVPRQALDTTEAVRLILVKIWVTKVVPTGKDDDQKYPVVHFKGVSRSVDGPWEENANSDLRGTVRMTREGEVRWTTYSIFNGEERWKSEGIQLGGVRSARGVVGNWFDKNYDPHGPCGPTAFWKIADWNPRNIDKIFGQNPTIDGPASDLAGLVQDEEYPSSESESEDSDDPFQSQFHIITHLINSYGSGAETDSSGDLSLDTDPPFSHPPNSVSAGNDHHDQGEQSGGGGEEESEDEGDHADSRDDDPDDNPDDED